MRFHEAPEAPGRKCTEARECDGEAKDGCVPTARKLAACFGAWGSPVQPLSYCTRTLSHTALVSETLFVPSLKRNTCPCHGII